MSVLAPQSWQKTISENADGKAAAQTAFPRTRMRRTRVSEGMRRLVRETALEPRHLILPLFVEEGLDERTPIRSMPGVFRETEASVGALVREAQAQNLGAIMLFGVSRHKDATGSDSMRAGGLLDRMVRRAKDAAPEMVVIPDLCFCEYTDHGHCGPLDDNGYVINDATIENIGRQAVVAARAGADIVAPSGMMDGQVGAIRAALDAEGFDNLPIMAYAAKYASSFYGPFREAAGCSLNKGDRKTYQMDPANGDEALREVALDIEEGADMVMVKPGLPYLDILWRVKDTFKMPTFAYNISGEYAMLRFAAEAGALDYQKAMMEMLMCFRRAGADGILTYAAIDAARELNNR
ncbi:MAG: porphobilinogen synthase [Rhodospirillales bacterium]|nr:porphobilinogen synthase [Alphaproteobacteria bacterium]MCB9987070.1 porphobilinogen synthase [Rhodospirillales bacterium]USO08165.1 MAG: porphobilinogen synthase [Rhodospirillales bacterium]